MSAGVALAPFDFILDKAAGEIGFLPASFCETDDAGRPWYSEPNAVSNAIGYVALPRLAGSQPMNGRFIRAEHSNNDSMAHLQRNRDP
jgi:hypothetical protein